MIKKIGHPFPAKQKLQKEKPKFLKIHSEYNEMIKFRNIHMKLIYKISAYFGPLYSGCWHLCWYKFDGFDKRLEKMRRDVRPWRQRSCISLAGRVSRMLWACSSTRAAPTLSDTASDRRSHRLGRKTHDPDICRSSCCRTFSNPEFSIWAKYFVKSRWFNSS